MCVCVCVCVCVYIYVYIYVKLVFFSSLFNVLEYRRKLSNVSIGIW